jgi:hypothetical protein
MLIDGDVILLDRSRSLSFGCECKLNLFKILTAAVRKPYWLIQLLYSTNNAHFKARPYAVEVGLLWNLVGSGSPFGHLILVQACL